MRAESVGSRGEDSEVEAEAPVKSWVAAMAAARKWPRATSSEMGMSGEGSFAEGGPLRKAGGMLSGVRGW